ncbi:hypothetical protein FRX31_028431 [Thalictrum thalictroides]|uniref:Uncharacterized protein n=1 Tax=Thalictrum thalictroides TaxID=46969 RepID=A0A7J6VA55_THATH|nr:hypothetical protein FRX31_028431 [Thalictrum thalictroides]
MADMYRRNDENALVAQYDGRLMDEEELNLMRAEPGVIGSRHSQSDTEKRFIDRINRDKGRTGTQNSDKHILGNEKAVSALGANHTAGFVFPPPRRAGDQYLYGQASTMSLTVKMNQVSDNGKMDFASFKRFRDECNITAVKSTHLLNYGDLEREHVIEGEDDRASDAREEDPGNIGG